MEGVKVISRELVLVDWGPMTLTVSAWADSEARPVIAAKAGAVALGLLGDLSDWQRYMKLPAKNLTRRGHPPSVVARAVEATKQVSRTSGRDLTPMAAVAGAVADEVADYAATLGADRVFVNNGGDISLRLGPGQEAVVGLPLFPGGPPGHRLRVRHHDGVGGVATSGWRGRSFSPGLADQVAVWAGSSALADAAATCLAGEVTLDSPLIKRRPASDIDPDSDLGETPVTVGVGRLTKDQIGLALDGGERAARRLMECLPIGGVQLRLGEGRRLITRSREPEVVEPVNRTLVAA